MLRRIPKLMDKEDFFDGKFYFFLIKKSIKLFLTIA